MSKVAKLRQQRAAAFDAFSVLAEKPTLSVDERTAFDTHKAEIDALDDQIKRAEEAQTRSAATARPVAGQDNPTVPASVETDRYVKERSLVIGGIAKMLAVGGNVRNARAEAAETYGENHPVTRALITSSGAAGGFIVPPDYTNEIIELLRPRAVVRAANPRTMPMPRGTMRLPGQSAAATAGYGAEGAKIASSQPSLNEIIASYHKLSALVPVSNDMMRYADPAVDAFVRDDLVKVIALAEDKAFILSDGSGDAPRGMLAFANDYVITGGGTAGLWNSAANSTLASGGNFISSNETYTLATVAQELGGAVNKLDTANVPDIRRRWFMHPRSWNYLNNVQNSLGVYVYRDELSRGTLLGYPVSKSTQIPINLYDSSGSATAGTFVFLAEMDDALILDSMQLELAVSREGTYVDGGGNTVSAFQADQTLIRAITEHDFQMRHTASVAVIQNVQWAPAIS